VTARSHSSMNRDCLFILTVFSSIKTQPSESICNVFCIICAYIQFNVLINYNISYLKFNYKSQTKETLLPNIRLKQGGMSPQKQITVPK